MKRRILTESENLKRLSNIVALAESESNERIKYQIMPILKKHNMEMPQIDVEDDELVTLTWPAMEEMMISTYADIFSKILGVKVDDHVSDNDDWDEIPQTASITWSLAGGQDFDDDNRGMMGGGLRD